MASIRSHEYRWEQSTFGCSFRATVIRMLLGAGITVFLLALATQSLRVRAIWVGLPLQRPPSMNFNEVEELLPTWGMQVTDPSQTSLQKEAFCFYHLDQSVTAWVYLRGKDCTSLPWPSRTHYLPAAPAPNFIPSLFSFFTDLSFYFMQEVIFYLPYILAHLVLWSNIYHRRMCRLNMVDVLSGHTPFSVTLLQLCCWLQWLMITIKSYSNYSV